MKKNQPIFSAVFGDNWHQLPPVMRKHYGNRPYCDDVVTAKGQMDVEFGAIAKLLSPLLRLSGALVPYQGCNIPVTVYFRSELDSSAFCLDRYFHFPYRRSYNFYSKMVPIKDDMIVEYMKFGIGWKHRYRFNTDKVILEHQGYVWNVCGKLLRLPLGLLLGRVHAEEQAVDANHFRMKMNITHPVFGKLYEYRGLFEITDEITDEITGEATNGLANE